MDYKASILYKKLQSGLSMPLTIMFVIILSGYLFSYISTLYDKNWRVNFNIAQTKALLNADSGIALDAYTVLYKKDYVPSSSDTLSGIVDCIEGLECMGGYTLERYEDVDDETYQIFRGCSSIGNAYVEKHLFSGRSNAIKIERKRNLKLGHTSSLSDFQYLTDSEKAGGHPWVYEQNFPCLEENRRDVTFGGGDVMNQGWGGDPTCDVGFKTNGTFVMSNFGAPTFNITVSVIDNGDGTYNSPQGPTQGGNIFQGDPPLDTVKTTCLPPPGYEQMKRVIENSSDHLLIDSTSKLKWVPTFLSRDTLIMTEIEFFADGGNGPHGFHVTQWWYLMPPYLSDTTNGGTDSPFANAFNLDLSSFGGTNNNWNGFGVQDWYTCSNGSNVNTCRRYEEQLEWFHNTTLNSNNVETPIGTDSYGCSRGNTGFKHFDIPDIYYFYDQIEQSNDAQDAWVSQFVIDKEINVTGASAPNGDGFPDHLLREYLVAGGKITYFYNEPTAIYVKGGPVRVKGRYKGRYTIVTDEYQTYKRHAWGGFGYAPGSVPEDTLWTDIFITDDLLNADAVGSSLLAAQPDEACSSESGSDNRLGLVSGANLYVANTIPNGARSSEISFCDLNDDGNNESFVSDRTSVTIHAHMIAFNESFASQYSNNTYNNGGAETYSNPPYGDGQALLKYGGTSSNQCDGNSGAPGNANDGSIASPNPDENGNSNLDWNESANITFPLPDGSNDDERGTITVWGGIVQKNRGYVVRNGPGPYDTNNIGYGSKSYNFDCNLKCPGGFPPLYPENTTCDESSEEIPYKVTAYY